MWLADLEKAVADVKAVCPDYLIDMVIPAGLRIAFRTTHHTWLYWRADTDEILEVAEEGDAKVFKKPIDK